MKHVIGLAVGFVFCCCNCLGQEHVRLEGVDVRYAGISKSYAEAIAATVATARSVAIDEFQFEMPPTVFVEIVADTSQKVRLFNDGQDRFSLTVQSEKDLAQPSKSGVFHIYGLCHEVGHLAMYRPIRDHSWLTYEAAEGWAHFIGSRLVDRVHEQLGPELWPDQYDYLRDGTRRLKRQLGSETVTEMAKAAGLWQEMTELAGDENVAKIFADWGSAEVDATNPSDALKKSLNNHQGLIDWFDRAEASLILKRPKSGIVAETISPKKLDGVPLELAHDDGKQAGKNSSAGGGHAVKFDNGPGGPAYLTSIRIHGSRYGRPTAPKEDFHVWLCDEEFRQIAEFKYAYAKFKRGNPEWVTLKTKPTKVPAKFIICVAFNPTGTKGVYVGYDSESSDHSLRGLPGRPPSAFDRGDWMIRASLERASHDEGLTGAYAEEDNPNKMRTWKDASGNFTLVAELVDIIGEKVRLKKASGEIISVPLKKLSTTDQEFLKMKNSRD